MAVLDGPGGARGRERGREVSRAGEVRAALLALNRPEAAFRVRDGRPDGADLVAELKIHDEHWGGLFAVTRIAGAFQILLRLDERRHAVRALDRRWRVRWRDGQPVLHAPDDRPARAGGGPDPVRARSAVGVGGTPEGDPELGCSPPVITGRLRVTVLEAGWAWHGVARGRL